MKNTLKFLSVLAAVSVIWGCSKGNGVPREPGKEYELVILHTNDHHGTTLAKKDSSGNFLGGLSQRGTFFKQVEAEHQNVLKLDAGDLNTGSALSNMFNAEPDILAYNLLGYDAVAFGNHEFDKPFPVLKDQMALSEFSWLSANIKTANGGYLGKPYIIKNYEGFRVGVFGLTTLRTKIVASPDESLKFINEITAAKETVKILREKEKADIVIALGHLGDVFEAENHVTSIMLAEEVSGIDLIIDGHSHSYFEEEFIANGVPIISANEWGKYIGEAIIKICDGKMTDFSWQAVAITNEFAPDPEVEDLLVPYIEKAEASLKEVIAQSDEKFEFGDRLPRYQETAIGDLVCDAAFDYIRTAGIAADFALQNGGTIRSPLPKGDITKEDVLTMLPFENFIFVVTLKGTDLLDLFEFVGSIKQGAGAFAQVSKEARYTITYNNGEGKISDITINGVPVDAGKTYKVITNDYLAKGGDGYSVFEKSTDTYNTSMTLCDVVIDYLKKQSSSVTPATDGRITVVNGAVP